MLPFSRSASCSPEPLRLSDEVKKEYLPDNNVQHCSDEEEFDHYGTSDGLFWAPFPEAVANLYEQLGKNSGVAEFDWKEDLERRRLYQDYEAYRKTLSSTPAEVKVEAPEVTDFDFDLEDETKPKLSRSFGKSATPKGGGKKKTTSLAGILSNMERHRIMDQMDTVQPRVPGNTATRPKFQMIRTRGQGEAVRPKYQRDRTGSTEHGDNVPDFHNMATIRARAPNDTNSPL